MDCDVPAFAAFVCVAAWSDTWMPAAWSFSLHYLLPATSVVSFLEGGLWKVVTSEGMASVCTKCPYEHEGCRKFCKVSVSRKSCLKCCRCSHRCGGFASMCKFWKWGKDLSLLVWCWLLCTCSPSVIWVQSIRSAFSLWFLITIRNLHKARNKLSTRLYWQGKERMVFGGCRYGGVLPFTLSSVLGLCLHACGAQCPSGCPICSTFGRVKCRGLICFSPKTMLMAVAFQMQRLQTVNTQVLCCLN